ncbi:hypothetical protein K490DRAFT_59794 [Saccharata proteae CBS 121410]|uniref:Uncharacterized protein n=1 Tax=Saccharata proteae CBS 121410 TaxID=1314787 RepID=A0A9P4HPB7_9PEZI|nr:hypothetical protein K490DRAFT_59794 [Saccharata proteae CBS 121410]
MAPPSQACALASCCSSVTTSSDDGRLDHLIILHTNADSARNFRLLADRLVTGVCAKLTSDHLRDASHPVSIGLQPLMLPLALSTPAECAFEGFQDKLAIPHVEDILVESRTRLTKSMSRLLLSGHATIFVTRSKISVSIPPSCRPTNTATTSRFTWRPNVRRRHAFTIVLTDREPPPVVLSGKWCSSTSPHLRRPSVKAKLIQPYHRNAIEVRNSVRELDQMLVGTVLMQVQMSRPTAGDVMLHQKFRPMDTASATPDHDPNTITPPNGKEVIDPAMCG